MVKKPDSKVGRSIYAQVEKEATNLPNELYFEKTGVTLKKERNQYCCSGANRTRSIYGGYGHHCFQEFVYENFSFTVSFNSDFPTPHIEFVIKGSDGAELGINIDLTENYWNSTSMMLEVQKAYYALTVDFDKVVADGSHEALIDSMPDKKYKDWAISNITTTRIKLFNNSPEMLDLLSKQKDLEVQISLLTVEMNSLRISADKETFALQRSLREKYLLENN